jgi:hypothetical protein
MKKQMKKLVLAKETVAALIVSPSHVAGGATLAVCMPTWYCTTGCPQSGKYPC